jgi:DNA primase
MALPAGFLDELRARTPLPALIGRRMKLARSGRQWKGCCPFHGEKSPSFHVYDDHFHCFGCGAHGDAISFVMQSQGASFPEAVEQLAGEAGLEVPRPSPQAAEAEARRHDLHSVLEAAKAAFQRRLFLPEGARALAYLRGRALTDDTIRRFGLGWSGEGRGALAAELARDGVEPAQLIEAGLMQPGEEGRPPRDLFFNRVIFPINDRRGRVISFGGRTLGDGQPKYLNGPETEVYSKRRTLYCLDLAREAARTGRPVVVVEGYMDVISLHQAGFPGAVAPLGTALTDDQLAELWRLSPAPILCFDGDAAGGRAAARAAELALPLIGPERTLRFVALSAGDDPDSLVRKSGPPAFDSLLRQARPLSDVLFDLLREGTDAATPEHRAALRARLEQAAGRITDRNLAYEYRRALMDRFFASRPARPGARPARAAPALTRPAPGGESAAAERARILVAILLRHPGLLADVEEAFGAVALPAPLSPLREGILHAFAGNHPLDSATLMNHLTQTGLAGIAAQALSAVPYPLPACAAADAQPAEAFAGWWEIFGLMNRGGLDDEVAAARNAFEARCDAITQRRLMALSEARERVRRVEQELDAEPT